jgi:hypothetical protein
MVDSGGRLVARDSTWIDSLSTGIRPGGFTVYRDSLTGSAPVRTLSRPMVINSGGSLLTSGTASIRETLERVLAGEIRSYQDVIGMTRTTGWRRP